jgi:hypothetical protein
MRRKKIWFFCLKGGTAFGKGGRTFEARTIKEEENLKKGKNFWKGGKRFEKEEENLILLP